MRTPSPLPEPLRGRPFTSAQAADAGLNPERLRRSDLVAPFHGVRVPVGHEAVISPVDLADPGGREDGWSRFRELAIARARAVAPRIPEQAVFSHTTAARLHGLPLPERLGRDLTVHVSTSDPRIRPRIRGVRGHLVPAGRQRREWINGMRVTTSLDTWCAMSTLLGVEELTVMGDALVCRRNPRATPGDLAAAVRGYAGRTGVRRLREARGLVRPRTDSPYETRVRLALLRAGLPEPEINGWVCDERGRPLRLGDMLYREYRVLIEYDGAHHFDDPRQFRKDIDVLDEAAAHGWRVIRAHRGHRRAGFAPVVDRVRRALIERGWRS